MAETLSIRIDSETKKRLNALSKRSKRSKSFLAAEAIAVYTESQEWQLGELHARIGEERVSKWLDSWGKVGETKSPEVKIAWSRRAMVDLSFHGFDSHAQRQNSSSLSSEACKQFNFQEILLASKTESLALADFPFWQTENGLLCEDL